MKRSKKLLFVARSAPYGSARARTLLDVVLAAAVFEQDAAMLFLGDGVYQLSNHQDGSAVSAKTLGKSLAALPLYGIGKLFAEAAALPERGLELGELALPVEPLCNRQIRELFERADVVFNL